jgi:hypothetical protein
MNRELPASGPLLGAFFCKNEAEGFEKSLSLNPGGMRCEKNRQVLRRMKRQMILFMSTVIEAAAGSAWFVRTIRRRIPQVIRLAAGEGRRPYPERHCVLRGAFGVAAGIAP